MPYGEKSAYAAQAALKKKSPAYKKSSSFKIKSSPTKLFKGLWKMLGGALTGGGGKFGAVNMIKGLFK